MEDLKDSLPALKIDVATWRREIQTFVEMTIDELTAINDQLAAPFSGSSGLQNGRVKSELGTRSLESDHQTPASDNGAGAHPSRTDERLISMKRKLAAKLSGTSQGNHKSG